MSSSSLSTVLAHCAVIYRLQQIQQLLGWDEQVNLPSNAVQGRAAQLSALASLIHEKISDSDHGKRLADLQTSSDNLTASEKLIVDDAKRQFEKATRLPSSFIAKQAKAQSESYHAWTKAREQDNYSSYAPFLQEQFALAKEEASFFDQSNPYDYWLDKHDPGLNSQAIEPLFADLKAKLIPLVDKLTQSSSPSRLQDKIFPIAQQKKLLSLIVEKLGFDFTRGRIDTAVHPFCGGSGDDIRLTTRYSEHDPLDSIFSAIHEAGHGIYEQNLPQSPVGTIFTENAGMAVHESQSRIWENQVGRSRSFWEFWYPKAQELFPNALKDISLEQWHQEILRVSKNPIRVDSDEITYNLHIILRTEIELLIFNSDISITELPQIWNDKTKELFGFTPHSNREGILQDVHWSCGAIGYFPSYTLGNLLAAQLWDQILSEQPNIEKNFSTGDFLPIKKWMTQHVHSLGKTKTALEIAKSLTSQPLSSDSLIKYLKERYV